MITNTHCFHFSANMLVIIRDYIKDLNVTLHHIVSKENACADMFVKLGANGIDPSITVHKSAPCLQRPY